MVSRSECDAAFQFLGYSKFERKPTAEVQEKVQQLELAFQGYNDFKFLPEPEAESGESGSKKFCLLTDADKLKLIDAQRCNAMCLDSDTRPECTRKLQINFDRVQSVELANVFPELCLYLIRVVDDSAILCDPVDPATWWYQHVLRPKHRTGYLLEFIHRFGFWFYGTTHFPTNVNVWKVRFLYDDETEHKIQQTKNKFDRKDNVFRVTT